MMKRLFHGHCGPAALGFAVALLAGCSRRADKPADADSSRIAAPADARAGATGPAPGTSLDCVKPSSDIEKLVCNDVRLSMLNQKLANVYQEAAARQVPPVSAAFVAEQQNWVTGRDECGTRPDPRACVDTSYALRIAAIQATNLLVPTKGPVTYACAHPDGAHDEVVAMFADTDPPSVVLERGDRSIVAYLARSASGAKYEGANVLFWEKSGEAQVTWFGTGFKCREQAGSS